MKFVLLSKLTEFALVLFFKAHSFLWWYFTTSPQIFVENEDDNYMFKNSLSLPSLFSHSKCEIEDVPHYVSHTSRPPRGAWEPHIPHWVPNLRQVGPGCPPA